MTFAATFVVMVGTSCQAGVGVEPFPDFALVDRVVVTRNSGRDTLALITDAERVSSVVAFANARNVGWYRPWAGVPVSQIEARFYGQEYQGHFGAGLGFFETHRAGTFASRQATSTELREFAHLVGIEYDLISASK